MKGRARPCSAPGMAPNKEEQRELWQELLAGVRAHGAAVKKEMLLELWAKMGAAKIRSGESCRRVLLPVSILAAGWRQPRS